MLADMMSLEDAFVQVWRDTVVDAMLDVPASRWEVIVDFAPVTIYPQGAFIGRP